MSYAGSLGNKRTELRQLTKEDAPQLALIANDKSIFDNVRDHFPHPYGLEDAIGFIEICQKEEQPLTFGIFTMQQLAGIIGIKRQTDVYRMSGEVGYWLGAEFRGQGIAVEALQLVTEYGVNQLNLNRLFATVFENNPASMKVLEKCGYLEEGIFRKAAIKNGILLDEHRYGYLVNP